MNSHAVLLFTLLLSENHFLSEVAEIGASSSGQSLKFFNFLSLECFIGNSHNEGKNSVDLRDDINFSQLIASRLI